jgi:beta-glucosidase
LASSAGTLADAPWPNVAAAYARDPALEARIAEIVAGMTLAQKVGQMTQAEIKSATPDDVRRYYLGSILSGGGSWPEGNKHASVAEWLAWSERYYRASMSTDMATPIPVIWGIDAVHGHSNVYGATLFPHNIGIGATHDLQLARDIGAATARAVRATGIQWVFAPTLAVVQDERWGRTYESFSEDPGLVQAFGDAYVRGLQDRPGSDGSVVATAKHFIGDGGTDNGKDHGVATSTPVRMAEVHARGYAGALGAGALAVMASFNSWNDIEGGVDYGKLHGSRPLLTDVLKTRMGFGGLIVSDWNGIAEVPGCRVQKCAQAVNAGIDMFMVPNDWKAFIRNTIAQVEKGEIPMARIDDAVTRILRVKLRAGLFDKPPSASVYAGRQDVLLARELARRAVRESLVLLKNNGHVLPLQKGRRILVVGKGADSFPMQTGGWSLTWQGTDNTNADFPNGQTILAGLREVAGAEHVTYSADGYGVDPSRFDAIVAVIGETPYAEGNGDIGASGSLRHASRHPEDLSVLRAVADKGVPVVTVFLSGRPLYVNSLLNLSDAFVAAWLPGTEGGGVADLLIASDKPEYAFTATLPFSWPSEPCQTAEKRGDPERRSLFALGYGLKSTDDTEVPQLSVDEVQDTCGAQSTLAIFTLADQASYPLALVDASARVVLGKDPNAVYRVANASVATTQINTQQDARRVTWTGPARLVAQAAVIMAVPEFVRRDGILRFDTIVAQPPRGKVELSIGCGPNCSTTIDMTALFARIADNERHTVKIPLRCFASRANNLTYVDMPFSIGTDAAWRASFANIQFVGGVARDADVLTCKGGKRE